MEQQDRPYTLSGSGAIHPQGAIAVPGAHLELPELPPRRTDGRPSWSGRQRIDRPYRREALYSLHTRRDQRVEVDLGDVWLTEPARQAVEVLPPVQVGIHQGLLGLTGGQLIKIRQII